MSWFTKVENEFKKLFSKVPTWQQTASGAITITAPLLEELIAQTAGESTAAEVTSVINEVQTDLATVSALIKGTGSTATLSGVLESIKTNLSGLLTAGHIKDAATLTKVTGIVNTVIAEVEAIASVVPK